MPKKIQLTIPKPCHEDWDAMTPVEKGKFCGSCHKQVVDFSVMSDRQVAQFFKKPSTGSVCGRFMTDQLDRDIAMPKKRIPWLRYFFTIALPAFFVSIKVSASRTQGKIKVTNAPADTTRRNIYDDVKMMGMVTRPQSIKPFVGDTVVVPVNNKPVCDNPVTNKPSPDKIKGEVAPLPVKNVEFKTPDCNKNIRLGGVSVVNILEYSIKGLVVDEQNKPIPYASIETPDKKIIVADEDGYFEIKSKSKSRISKLVVTAAGYYGKEYAMGEHRTEAGKYYIQLKANDQLPEIVVSNQIGLIKRHLVGGVVSVARKTHSTHQKDKTANLIKIFPNPITAGTALTIEWKQTDEGYYNLQIANTAGQPVHQKEIWIDAEARLLNINMPVVAAGSYFLVLTNKKSGKRFTERVVVQ